MDHDHPPTDGDDASNRSERDFGDHDGPVLWVAKINAILACVLCLSVNHPASLANVTSAVGRPSREILSLCLSNQFLGDQVVSLSAEIIALRASLEQTSLDALSALTYAWAARAGTATSPCPATPKTRKPKAKSLVVGKANFSLRNRQLVVKLFRDTPIPALVITDTVFAAVKSVISPFALGLVSFSNNGNIMLTSGPICCAVDLMGHVTANTVAITALGVSTPAPSQSSRFLKVLLHGITISASALTNVSDFFTELSLTQSLPTSWLAADITKAEHSASSIVISLPGTVKFENLFFVSVL